MASFLDRAKSVIKTAEKAPEVDAAKVLKGTGITARVIERNEKAYEKEVDRSLNTEQSLLKTEAEQSFENAIKDTIEALRDGFAKEEITLDESQIEALAGIIHNRFSILIGAAGTGKTTLTKRVVEELSKRVEVIDMREARFTTITGPDGKPMRVKESARGTTTSGEVQKIPAIAFAAYTGRASQQTRRSLPEKWHRSISTIHALLGYAPVGEEYETFDTVTGRMEIKTKRVFRPSFNALCKLPFRVFFFDEASMIPIPLWNEFIDATYPNVRIVLTGDINQLPPTAGKSVLGFAMQKWPVFELRHIHRQAVGNAIISNAHRILWGKMPENASNFHLIGQTGKSLCPGGSSTASPYFIKVIKQLSTMEGKDGKKLFDPYRDAIICAWNDGPIGQNDLNNQFRMMFNPERKENNVIVNKRTHIHTGREAVYFALGDKVMITSNINTADPPITNGMIGIVDSLHINGRYDVKRAQVVFDDDDGGGIGEEIDFDVDKFAMEMATEEDDTEKTKKEESDDQRQSSHVMTIKFENGQTYQASTAGDYSRIAYGYAITCHKSQGGEYPNVVILCHSANAVTLSREWLYTAVTRARNNVYIVGNMRGLEKALNRQVIPGLTIKEKIKNYIHKTTIGDDGEVVIDQMRTPILFDNVQLKEV